MCGGADAGAAWATVWVQSFLSISGFVPELRGHEHSALVPAAPLLVGQGRAGLEHTTGNPGLLWGAELNFEKHQYRVSSERQNEDAGSGEV